MKKSIVTLTALLFLVFAHAENENRMDIYGCAAIVATSEIGGINSFCKAIVKGDIETVKGLIALGKDVNQKSLGMTPAIFAARYNRAEILTVLIANGADLNIRSDKGYSAVELAKRSNAHEALRVLEAHL